MPPPTKVQESRRRAAVEEPAGGFRQWPPDTPHPASSMLALVAGKCAEKQGSDAFERFHQAVFDAFFGECRDISNRDVLIELAAGAGLDVARFSQNLDDTWGEAAVLTDLAEAQRDFEGWGIPLVVIGEGFPLVGAVPVEIYRRAVDRCLVPGPG